MVLAERLACLSSSPRAHFLRSVLILLLLTLASENFSALPIPFYIYNYIYDKICLSLCLSPFCQTLFHLVSTSNLTFYLVFFTQLTHFFGYHHILRSTSRPSLKTTWPMLRSMVNGSNSHFGIPPVRKITTDSDRYPTRRLSHTPSNARMRSKSACLPSSSLMLNFY
jgi:hypothetical protein